LKIFRTGDTYRNDLPMELTADLLDLGQTKYDIYCAPCHGSVGEGDGPVQVRAKALGGWVDAKNLHDPSTREMTTGQLYEAITDGIRTMASYKSQLTPEERWAVVAYIRALQSTTEK
ncbi:MAG: cytochrome c, partial [bacterium]|nr:cytochrome c [bacterium]